jgi:ATP-dependent Clp protease ATP-binding subunit ClpA
MTWVNPDAGKHFFFIHTLCLKVQKAPAGEALKKYARDLTEAAQQGKLDPVIGESIITSSLFIAFRKRRRSEKNSASSIEKNEEQSSSYWRTRCW